MAHGTIHLFIEFCLFYDTKLKILRLLKIKFIYGTEIELLVSADKVLLFSFDLYLFFGNFIYRYNVFCSYPSNADMEPLSIHFQLHILLISLL